MSRPIKDGLNKYRRYRQKNPWRYRYTLARAHAQKRGIPFLLTFEEWRGIWEASGKWEQRGCHKGQYVMARYGDKGAYEISNVRICAQEENHIEWINDNLEPFRASNRGERNHNYGKNWSTITPEERSATALKMWAERTPEQRAMIAVKKGASQRQRLMRLPVEQRGAHLQKRWATLTPEQRSAQIQSSWSTLTPEERAARNAKLIARNRAPLSPAQRATRAEVQIERYRRTVRNDLLGWND